MFESIAIIIFILITSLAGYYFRLLTFSGSIAAFIVGAAAGWGFGFYGLLVLGFFFASSSFWSKFKSHKKRNSKISMQKDQEGIGSRLLQMEA